METSAETATFCWDDTNLHYVKRKKNREELEI